MRRLILNVLKEYGMMAKPELKNPDVKVHVGKSYGAARQPPDSRRNLPNVGERKKKFVDNSPDKREPDEVKAVTATIRQRPEAAAVADGMRIRWEKKRRKDCIIINCPQLMLTLRKRMCNPRPNSNSNNLYRAMLDGLQDPKFGVFNRFYIIAVGVSRRSSEIFIKLEGKGTKFILPQEFLRDCNMAFLKKSF